MRSRHLQHFRAARRPLLLAAALLLSTVAVWACAPMLAPWILGSDFLVLQGPTVRYSEEIRKVAPSSSFQARVPEGDDTGGALTGAQDLEDLRAALARTPEPRSREIVALHTGLRDTMAPYRLAAGAPPPPEPVLQDVAVPAGLPAEFADYLRGAIAYHQGRFADAASAWEALLRRPENERRFRSTWAAFMLGKVYLRGDRAQAVTWFQRTRELASDGFPDTLGLAASSLGWEARAELDRGRVDRALALYLQQVGTGDPSAVVSIRIVGRRALNAGPEALASLARSPEARKAMTAFVLDPPGDFYFDPTEYEDGRDWLQALKAAGVQDAEGADRLAWAAYLAGDFETAGQWLERAPRTPAAKWVRAKLLLREGRLAEAEALLAEVGREVAPATGSEEETWFWTALVLGPPYANRERALGEEGAVHLAQGEFTEAFDRLLRSGYWRDAAYVGERVLTPEELQAYVDSTWPASVLAGYEPPEYGLELTGGYSVPAPGAMAHAARYLLARRLARAGRYEEARPYFPATLHERLTALAAATAEGRDASRPAPDRAESLFRAACITRESGMRLLGTEVDPDWAFVSGDYEFRSVAEAREESRLLAPTPDERKRVERHRAEPGKRFHYRYRAADLAWEAAKLLPSGDRKAEILATAGNWIQNRDPKGADRFYKELVRTNTALGREADELRWFPGMDACR